MRQRQGEVRIRWNFQSFHLLPERRSFASLPVIVKHVPEIKRISTFKEFLLGRYHTVTGERAVMQPAPALRFHRYQAHSTRAVLCAIRMKRVSVDFHHDLCLVRLLVAQRNGNAGLVLFVLRSVRHPSRIPLGQRGHYVLRGGEIASFTTWHISMEFSLCEDGRNVLILSLLDIGGNYGVDFQICTT